MDQNKQLFFVPMWVFLHTCSEHFKGLREIKKLNITFDLGVIAWRCLGVARTVIFLSELWGFKVFANTSHIKSMNH